ncbi:hypothetical protein JT05_03380 [Desulfosporosinus sp. Tol-M]|nr:hypothetical protein JT05_03380 [Desulfosporosinus sp. Tol-M]
MREIMGVPGRGIRVFCEIVYGDFRKTAPWGGLIMNINCKGVIRLWLFVFSWNIFAIKAGN